jgi:Fe-S oxidoreductase
MVLENYRKDIYGCIKCGECRIGFNSQKIICPSGDKHGFNSYYALGRMDIAKGLLDGKLEWSDKTLPERVFTCRGCGACYEMCYPQTGNRTKEIFRVLKAEFVKRGFGPPAKFDPVLKASKEYDNYFGQPQRKRLEWAEGLDVKRVTQKTDVLFFVGCYEAFNPTTTFIARATANLLNKSGASWGILGEEEICCGHPFLEVGCEDEFERLARENIEKINATGIKTLLVSCSCCYSTIKNDWPKVGKLNFEPIHTSEYLLKLIKEDKLKVTRRFDKKLTIHDPCHLGRYCDVFEEPREVLGAIPGVDLMEMQRNRKESYCCGAGGSVNACFPDWATETATTRLEEATATGSELVVIPSCPICYDNFSTALPDVEIGISDLADLLDKVT